MQKLRLREGPAHILEKGHQLNVVWSAPGRQGNLKDAKADLVGDAEPLNHIGRREGDHADHGVNIVAPRFLVEDPHNVLEAGRVNGVAFAGGAKNVEMVEILAQVAYLLTEDPFQ